jgi:hypothetical protein
MDDKYVPSKTAAPPVDTETLKLQQEAIAKAKAVSQIILSEPANN